MRKTSGACFLSVYNEVRKLKGLSEKKFPPNTTKQGGTKNDEQQ